MYTTLKVQHQCFQTSTIDFLNPMNCCPRNGNCYTFVVKPTLQVPFIEESREGPTSHDDVICWKAAGRASFLYSKSIMYRRWERNSSGASLLPLPFAAKHMLMKFTKSQAKGPLVKILNLKEYVQMISNVLQPTYHFQNDIAGWYRMYQITLKILILLDSI